MKIVRLMFASVLAVTYPAQAAEEWEKPDSPFRMGEAYADVPATCETMARWIDHAPQVDARVSMSIVGEIASVDWDGALAYLVMCKETQVQVLCVTYSKDGVAVGDKVLFGGGYSRVDERRIMLDPCLANHEEG